MVRKMSALNSYKLFITDDNRVLSANKRKTPAQRYQKLFEVF